MQLVVFGGEGRFVEPLDPFLRHVLGDFPVGRHFDALGVHDLPHFGFEPVPQVPEFPGAMQRIDIKAPAGRLVLGTHLRTPLVLQFLRPGPVVGAHDRNPRLQRTGKVDEIEPVLQGPPLVLIAAFRVSGLLPILLRMPDHHEHGALAHEKPVSVVVNLLAAEIPEMKMHRLQGSIHVGGEVPVPELDTVRAAEPIGVGRIAARSQCERKTGLARAPIAKEEKLAAPGLAASHQSHIREIGRRPCRDVLVRGLAVLGGGRNPYTRAVEKKRAESAAFAGQSREPLGMGQVQIVHTLWQGAQPSDGRRAAQPQAAQMRRPGLGQDLQPLAVVEVNAVQQGRPGLNLGQLRARGVKASQRRRGLQRSEDPILRHRRAILDAKIVELRPHPADLRQDRQAGTTFEHQGIERRRQVRDFLQAAGPAHVEALQARRNHG